MDEDIEMTFHLKEAAFVRLTDNQAYPDDMNMEELENE